MYEIDIIVKDNENQLHHKKTIWPFVPRINEHIRYKSEDKYMLLKVIDVVYRPERQAAELYTIEENS